MALVICAALVVLCACFDPGTDPKEETPTGGVIIVIETPQDTDPAETPVPVITEEPEISPTEAPTDTPEPTNTPEPTDTPEPTPYRDVYYDLDAVRTFYVEPDKAYTFDFGDTSGWTVDGRGVMTVSFSGSQLKVKASSTGYAKLSGPDGLIGYIYSGKAVEKTEARRVKEGFPYYIYYEKGKHVMVVYEADDEGYYTVPVRTISCASGSTPSKTPVGNFELGEKMRWKVFSANCHAQYGIQYASGVFLHGPCYGAQRESSIISYYYNTIGDSSTGGCLRMQTGNIYWIYMNCDSGTKLEIVDGSPRGLDCEKPSEIPESACYDPTDPVLKK